MAKEIFGFSINDQDSDEPYNDEDYMFYTCKNETLHPVSEDFESGLPAMHYSQAIDFLIQNGIKEVTTFTPASDKVASFPYEIEREEDYKRCVADGIWDRVQNNAIERGGNLEMLMKESDIKLRRLSQEEKETLNEKLRDYPD